MPVTTEEVAAAKVFLSELPLGIASTTGIAAVRTLLASHQDLESVLKSAEDVAGNGVAAGPADIIGTLVARVAKLKEALDARGAEAIVLKDRNALTEARLREVLDELGKRDEQAGRLDEERQRASRAESNLRRAEERIREGVDAAAALHSRVAELERLFGAADAEQQLQARRADTAEASERAAREAGDEKDAVIAALRVQLSAEAGSASDAAAALERRIAALTSSLAARELELSELEARLRAEKERTDDLVRSGEAQASYAQSQQDLILSLRRELDERMHEISLLGERLEATNVELGDARARGNRLHEALLPFAEMAESYDLADANWVVDSGWCEDRKHRIVVADFRAARSVALAKSRGSGSTLAPDLGDEREVAPRPDPVREETAS
ncbi:MAG: hypothetical protein KIS68_16660 [Bauldia sp.]|nr:hypothetical protein [Bauldia sp.]